MTRILVDTSAFLTLLDQADDRNELARSTLLSIQAQELVTHGYVVAETLAVARRRFGVDGVVRFLDDMLPAFEVLAVDREVHADAQALYRASLPSGTSFVDQVSFAVMNREAIDTAFALDADFVKPGIVVLPRSLSA